MNLPTAGSIVGRGHRGVLPATHLRRGLTSLRLEFDAHPGALTVFGASIFVALTAVLEVANPRNSWLLWEDLSATIAPAAGSIALLVAARHWTDYPRFRRALVVALALVAAGQGLACVPDVTGRSIAALSGISEVCYVVGSVMGIIALLASLYGRMHPYERLITTLNGLVIIAAAMTVVLANWIHQSIAPAGQASAISADPASNLFLPLVSALFFSSAAAAVVAALSLRVVPSRGGVWAVSLGIVLMAIAWEGWLARFIAGTPDGIEPMDFIFPAGSLAVAWGGVSWSVATGGGRRYERFAGFTSTWLPVVAIAGCAILDVMPRSRPLDVDPVALGTATVVFLTVARQAVLQNREREARDRFDRQESERTAAATALANLELGASMEESAERICLEALRLEGIDTVIVFGFTPSGVVPLAQAGPPTRAVAIGQPLPDEAALAIKDHAMFGLWLERWSGKDAANGFDRATVASGLIAEAMSPLIWNDEIVGVLALGATTREHALRLEQRVTTLTEFSVMSGAFLGPALADRAQRETTIAEVRAVIVTRAFTPVFQPIVDLDTREFVGYESLTRFKDGTRPDVRFLAADKVGMMVELERACLREQIAQARKLPPGSFLTLNVSPALAIEPDPLIELLRQTDRPVVLEVTEHVEIEDYPKLMEALNRVRPMAMLAVDDAGAGYAGLRHILELRPQYVKLDISLVRNIDTDPARQAMVTGMAHFAESVGCSLIAEGIETANELTTLRLLRIPFGQGYHLAKPAPVELGRPPAVKGRSSHRDLPQSGRADRDHPLTPEASIANRFPE